MELHRNSMYKHNQLKQFVWVSRFLVGINFA